MTIDSMVTERTSVPLQQLRENLRKVIRGKDDVLENLLIAVLVGESVLIEDVPGVGKTTLAKTLATSIECTFQRIQCTPDLLPADVFGYSIFRPNEGKLQFQPGPIFSNILLVDEINRASPRTQSALLEAMAEGQVTIEGNTHVLPKPFIVLATQNPYGFHGTFPLPESQLDRFLMKFSLDYPDAESELSILYQESEHRPIDDLEPVLSSETVVELQSDALSVNVDQTIARYLLEIVESTRRHPLVELGCSPRAAISSFRAVKAKAFLAGRDFALPDDVQQIAPITLAHRMVCQKQPDQGAGTSQNGRQIIETIIDEIEVPV